LRVHRKTVNNVFVCILNLVISENCFNFIVLNYKVLQTIIAMFTDDKVIELFCMADDFCRFF